MNDLDMLKNDVMAWKKSKNLLPLVKNAVAMAKASHKFQKCLCQNNPNKILLKVTKYLGTSRSSLEAILRKLPGGAESIPSGMNRVNRTQKKSSSYIYTIIYKNQGERRREGL